MVDLSSDEISKYLRWMLEILEMVGVIFFLFSFFKRARYLQLIDTGTTDIPLRLEVR